jgi:hypothetical protein
MGDGAVEPGHWISAYQGAPGLPGFGKEQSQVRPRPYICDPGNSKKMEGL